MSNDITSVSLGGYTFNIQNRHYNYPDGIQRNPEAALKTVGVLALTTVGWSSLLGTLGTICIGGPLGFVIGSSATLAIIGTTAFEGVDTKAIYDSGRFALDAAGFIIDECINSGEGDSLSTLLLGDENE